MVSSAMGHPIRVRASFRKSELGGQPASNQTTTKPTHGATFEPDRVHHFLRAIIMAV